MIDYIPLLVKFTESDKRILIAIVIIFLLIILLVGYIQKLVGYIMYTQGLQVDTMMYDILRTGVIVKKRDFKREARRKSHLYFLKKSWLPFFMFLLCTGGFLLYVYYAQNWDFSFFTTSWQQMSMDFDWHIDDFFGVRIPTDWPTLIKTPDFSYTNEKYIALGFTILMAIPGIIYLIDCQALLSRSLRIRQLCTTYFAKNVNKLSNDHA